MEIGGHTDSQGRETMNQQLSQARARSVLEALRARRVLTSNITAKGYGESQPIADNDTDSGREENRRIEFKLIRLETQDDQSTLDSLAEPAQEGEETAAQTEEGATDEQD
jgi:OOP family OmpA-OmpF porin